MDCKKTKTLTFPFVILILGKSPNLGKRGFLLILTHYWSGLGRIPWWIMSYMSLEEAI